MKRLAILLLIILALTAAPVLADPSTLPADVLARLEIKYDKFEDTTSVSPITTYYDLRTNTPRLMLYAWNSSASKSLDIHVTYYGKSWMFLERAIILVNGARYETPRYSYSSGVVYRDIMDGGNILEQMFMTNFDALVAPIIKAIYDAGPDGNVEYMFYGSEGSSGGTMTRTELQAWRDVYDYYLAVEATAVR